MKVIPKTADAPKGTGLHVCHCLNCGRIWVYDAKTGSETCPKCENELHSISKDLTLGELRLGGGFEARVSQERLLRETADVLQGLINQTTCECSKGIRCFHCQGIALLRDFPGPEEGSLEDDWATLRGRPERSDPIKTFTEDETARYDRLLEDDEDDPNAPVAGEFEEEFEALLRQS
jgi:hypothetical protein